MTKPRKISRVSTFSLFRSIFIFLFDSLFFHGMKASEPWTMLDLPARCTRVWTIVPHVRGRVKSPTLPRYAWLVGFISLE
jgi:hypothetical protein